MEDSIVFSLEVKLISAIHLLITWPACSEVQAPKNVRQANCVVHSENLHAGHDMTAILYIQVNATFLHTTLNVPNGRFKVVISVVGGGRRTRDTPPP